MGTHISARLAWHDLGWNGCVCNNPNLNVYCMVHEHIRDSRDDEFEEKHTGKKLNEINLDNLPPCSRDPAAFSETGFRAIHRDPVYWRNLPPTEEDIPANSFCTTPYGRMFKEGGEGWENDSDEQLKRLINYWKFVEPKKSLIFFYVNHGNPLKEEKDRILVGIGRVSRVGPQLYFGKNKSDDRDNPLWSKCVTQNFPKEGIRLPYQEYLQKGLDHANIVCAIPGPARPAFRYVSEQVSDDIAVGIIERVIHSVKTIISENQITEPYGKTWEYRLNWLNTVLGEVWENRGRFPGIGSILEYLGFRGGILFHKSFTEHRKDVNIFEYTFSILDGKEKPITQFKREFSTASEKWKALPEKRRELLKVLSHFELSPEQIKRVCNPTDRKEAFIVASEEELLENPYIIAELDDGESESELIDFETIDRGMIPSEDITNMKGAIEPIQKDDKKRIRAIVVDVMNETLEQGDTCLTLDDVFKRVRNKLPENRLCDLDKDIFLHYRNFYGERISFFPEKGEPKVIALRTIRKMEEDLRGRIKKLVERTYKGLEPEYWKKILEEELKDVKVFDRKTEDTARVEKVIALNKLFSNRFSILTGKAGTGKTTVLKTLIRGLDEKEGKQPVLLLAPTGKARVQLQKITKKPSQTIHQFLMRHGWIRGVTFSLKEKGESYGAPTVIIDESSMLPLDLFATLCRAIDFNEVQRLILVGDPNQLPPIGSGRPFVDIIKWIEETEDKRKHIAYLSQRVRHEKLESQALLLADAFIGEKASPGDDEIISKAARQDVAVDLEVHFWEDEKDLDNILNKTFKENLGFDTSKESDYENFNKSIETSNKWQMLSPTRMNFFGTSEINRIIQRTFKGGLIERAKKRRKPPPLGDQQMVWSDKVIQIVNSKRNGWLEGKKQDGYVANGEVGQIKNTFGNSGLEIKYSTQPKVNYRYYGSEVNENLELAYAITVHKAQGSDFDIVFLILPQNAKTMSKELLYTGLTRFKKKMILLLEKDINPLLVFRNPQYSEILQRNTNIFELSVRPDTVGIPHPEKLIHKTSTGVLVRSKSEVIIANILTKNDISYDYEKPLYSKKDQKDFRLPDFTVKYEGQKFYWEHLGMLIIPEYKKAWKKKEEWYKENGYLDRVVVSKDGPDGSINSIEVEKLAKEKILCEERSK